MALDPVPFSKPGDLQFDQVAGVAPAGTLTCSNCHKPIEGTYYQLRDKPICESCKAQIDASLVAHFARGRGAGGMMRAVLFGLGAAIAGAALYYIVAVVTKLEIGLVAIVIGYMVGYAIQKAVGGVGGRRFQILAVAYTYLAVGAAYAALGLKEVADVSVLLVVFSVVAMPVFAVFSSGLSGILTVIIIGVGLRQAWRMTSGARVNISGPYKVGGVPPAVAR